MYIKLNILNIVIFFFLATCMLGLFQIVTLLIIVLFRFSTKLIWCIRICTGTNKNVLFICNLQYSKSRISKGVFFTYFNIFFCFSCTVLYSSK